MFKAKRLIYKEKIITEGFPDVLHKVTSCPFKVGEKAMGPKGIQRMTQSIGETVEGVLKGGKEVGITVKNLVWDDFGAGVRSLTYKWFQNLKSATWDTFGNLSKGEIKEAGKSLVWTGALGAMIATPVKAAINQVEGLINVVPDTISGALRAVGQFTGIGIDREGRNYGLVPAAGSLLSGGVGALASPLLGKGEVNWFERLMDGTLRFNTSVRKKAEVEGKTEG